MAPKNMPTATCTAAMKTLFTYHCPIGARSNAPSKCCRPTNSCGSQLKGVDRISASALNAETAMKYIGKPNNIAMRAAVENKISF